MNMYDAELWPAIQINFHTIFNFWVSLFNIFKTAYNVRGVNTFLGYCKIASSVMVLNVTCIPFQF